MKSLTQNLNILLISSLLLLGTTLLGTEKVEAKQAQSNFTVSDTFTYYYNRGSLSGSCGGYCGWNDALRNPTIKVDYYADIFDQDAQSKIFDGESIQIGTNIEIKIRPHVKDDIFWFGSGYSFDSPYGDWVSDADVPSNSACKSSDYVSNSYGAYSQARVYIPLSIAPPDVTYAHSGTAALSCNAAGNLCTVTSAGSIVAEVNFAPTYGKFYYRYNGVSFMNNGGCTYNNVPLSLGPRSFGTPSSQNPPYILSVPAKTIDFSILVSPMILAPTGMTIDGETEGLTLVSYDFDFTGAGIDVMRYEIDWDNDGIVDELLPSFGYVAPGTTLTSSKKWSNEGLKTIRARAKNSTGGYSPWSEHSIDITKSSLRSMIDVIPLEIDFGYVDVGSISVPREEFLFVTDATFDFSDYKVTGSISGALNGPFFCDANCDFAMDSLGIIKPAVISFNPLTGGAFSEIVTFKITFDDPAATPVEAFEIKRLVKGYGVVPLSDLVCSVSPTTGGQNEFVTWSADVSGGTPPYYYKWSGNPPLDSVFGKEVAVQYGTLGMKVGSVEVTDAAGISTGQVVCDNSFTASVSTLPNLVSQSLTETSLQLIEEGVSLSITAEVMNDSTEEATEFFDSFSYSIDGGLSFVDILTTYEHLGLLPLAQEVDSTILTVPLGSAGGTLVIQHCVDVTNLVTEDDFNETFENHCSELDLGVITALPVIPSGFITASSCTIGANETSCPSTVTWSSSDFVGIPSILQGATNFSAMPSDTETKNITPDDRVFYLKDTGSAFQRFFTAGAGCVDDTVWTSVQCYVLPVIEIDTDSKLVRMEETADITVSILSSEDLNCTLYGALTGVFVHTGSVVATTYTAASNPIFTTSPLTSARVARVECVSSDLSLPMVNDGAQLRIEVVPSMQEV